jgi:hypothetical protein
MATAPVCAAPDPIDTAIKRHQFALAERLLQKQPPAQRSINRKIAIATVAYNAGDYETAQAQIEEVRAAPSLTPQQAANLATLVMAMYKPAVYFESHGGGALGGIGVVGASHLPRPAPGRLGNDAEPCPAPMTAVPGQLDGGDIPCFLNREFSSPPPPSPWPKPPPEDALLPIESPID